MAFKDGEALEPGSSIAAVARRHGLNAYLGFKWIRRAREGWLDLQRALAMRRGFDVARRERAITTHRG